MESVNELLKKLLPQADCDSQHKSTVKAKRKKNKEGTLKRDVKDSQISDSLSETNLTSDNKRKKKKTFEDFSPTNGHHSEVLEENEEIEVSFCSLVRCFENIVAFQHINIFAFQNCFSND